MTAPYGFEKIREGLANDMKNGKLHHCHLVSGTRGIGKFCFVCDFAATILSVREDGREPTELEIERTGKLIASGGHTDFVLLNVATPEEDGGESTSKREEIGVKQVRRVTLELKLTQSISKNRVLVVDSIDSVNINGQNALLKTLEEPGANTYIFLVHHNMRRILDTVKSRCKLISVTDPTLENWTRALKNHVPVPLENSLDELENLYNLSGHSIGLALDIVSSNAQNLYHDLVENISIGNPMNIQKLAEDIYKSNMFGPFKIFMDRFFGDVLRLYREGRPGVPGTSVAALAAFLERNNLESVIGKYEYSGKMIRDIELYNLDKKHCISVLLSKLSSPARL